MNLKLMQEAKEVATDTLRQNFGTILTIILIAGMPIVFCNYYIASFFPLEVFTETLTIEQFTEIVWNQGLIQCLSVLVQLIFYPITISSMKIILNMYFEKTSSINNLFFNYSSINRIFRTFALFGTIWLAFLIKLLPYIFIISLVLFASEMIFLYNQTLGLIFLVPLYGVTLYIMFKALGAYIHVLIFENICILNFDDSEFSRKKLYYDLKTIFYKKSSELSNLGISFFFPCFLGFTLANFTLGISIFIFYIYLSITLVYYTTKNNSNLLPNNVNNKGEFNE
ncbi:MAG: hypothetical protein R3Y12_05845 [Clostridia bacterium]